MRDDGEAFGSFGGSAYIGTSFRRTAEVERFQHTSRDHLQEKTGHGGDISNSGAKRKKRVMRTTKFSP